MRGVILLLGGALFAACAPPPEGSIEAVARLYGEAVLQSDTGTLNRYVASGRQVPYVPRDAHMAAPHVIRVCANDEDGGGARNVVALYGGDLNKPVRGIQMQMVREGAEWRVKSAQVARRASGRPLHYERHCGVSLGANNWYWDHD